MSRAQSDSLFILSLTWPLPFHSILVFLPSTMLSGIMFPIELLPEGLKTAGKIFPASWGYRLMTEFAFRFETLLPLLLILAIAVVACGILLRKVGE